MLVLVETSGGDDAMGVGMEEQFARPGVQHSGQAELRVQPAVAKVEQGARNQSISRSYISLGFTRANPRSSWGSVKTTWKYLVGMIRWRRCSIHRAWVRLWHFGQWRFRQEL